MAQKYAWVWLLVAATVSGCGSSCSDGSMNPEAATLPAADSGDGETMRDAAPDSTLDAPSDVGLDAESPAARCIEQWPSLESFAAKSPLATSAPQLLWKKSQAAGLCQHEPTLAGDSIAVSCANQFSLFDRDGNTLVTLPTGSDSASPAVADADGNLYVATFEVQSLTPGGEVRWKFQLGGNLWPYGHLTFTSNILLSPDGILYFAASDGFLYARKAEDGSVVWKKPLLLEPGWRFVNLRGGVGDTFFMDNVPYVAATGEPSGEYMVDGKVVNAWYGTSVGILGKQFHSVPGESRIASRLFFLDACGKVRWSTPDDHGSWNALVDGPDGGVLLNVWTDSETQQAFVYSSEGQPVAGPVPFRGDPMVVGADGVVYTKECSGPTPEYGPMTIHAYDWQLKYLWSLDLGESCTPGGAALASDGVLYVTRDKNGLELFAIQTTSPGGAATGLSTRMHDNRRTGWLHAGTGSSASP